MERSDHPSPTNQGCKMARFSLSPDFNIDFVEVGGFLFHVIQSEIVGLIRNNLVSSVLVAFRLYFLFYTHLVIATEVPRGLP